jgi:hypothetical protein
MARLERLRLEGQLISRKRVREAFNRVSSILKSVGESLQRQFGPKALDVLNEGLDDAEREVKTSFADGPEALYRDEGPVNGSGQ